jgi:hypothetical protein
MCCVSIEYSNVRHSECDQRLAMLDSVSQQRCPAMLTADGLKVASAYWRVDAASTDVHAGKREQVRDIYRQHLKLVCECTLELTHMRCACR